MKELRFPVGPCCPVQCISGLVENATETPLRHETTVSVNQQWAATVDSRLAGHKRLNISKKLLSIQLH